MNRRWRIGYFRGEHKIYFDKKGPYIILNKGTGAERRLSLRGHSSILKRIVQYDGKGIYVYYGGFRFRPKGETKSFVGSEVGLVSPYQEEKMRNDTIVHVGNRSEIWILK